MIDLRARLFRWIAAQIGRWRVRSVALGSRKSTLSDSRQLAGPSALTACATVVIPALNEAARIADVVAYALRDPATAEVIVVDDSSIDDTAVLARQAGARVIMSTMLGKGASMRDGLLCANCELVVYLDGDLSGLRPSIVTDFVGL